MSIYRIFLKNNHYQCCHVFSTVLMINSEQTISLKYEREKDLAFSTFYDLLTFLVESQRAFRRRVLTCTHTQNTDLSKCRYLKVSKTVHVKGKKNPQLLCHCCHGTDQQGWTQCFSINATYIDLPEPLISSLTPTYYHQETLRCFKRVPTLILYFP